MNLFRAKSQEQKKPAVVYVPVMLSDNRSYVDKWKDNDYLRDVLGFSRLDAYKTEVVEALIKLRDYADNANSTAELKGINTGIAILKSLLTVEVRAEHKINANRYEKKLKQELEQEEV
jgi:hypothetical protein